MATTNSFIANVNLLASKLNTVLQAVDLFDENVIPILEEIAALDLNEAINDLKKGNYLGNRKLDINLSYNMEGIDENTSEQEASAIWLDSTKTVLYNSATAIFKDGSTVNIPFMYDGNPISISTHADLLTQLNNNENFLNKLDNTLIASFAAPVVGEIIRAYDVLGAASNLERLIIHAVSGSYKEANPSYYWVKTTSALQTLAMRVGDIIQIGNEIDNFILLANSLDSLMELQARIPELIDTFTNGEPNGDVTIYNSLSELMDIYDNLVALQTLYTNLPLLNTVHSNLDNINAVNSNASNINTVAINAGDVSVVSENISKVIPVADNISNVNAVANTVVPNMIDILQADDNAQLAKEYANKTTGQVEVNTYSAKEFAIGDSTASGGSAKAWAIDANSPDGTTSKSAKTWAEEASVSATNAANSATTATNKANEIKNVTVGSTSTGVAGTLAAVSYNSGTGQFHFVIPQGIKGDKGDAFTVNAYGTFAQRTLYDAQVKDFSFFATDLGKIYFKKSATSGDWSAGIDFGKGDKGDTGNAGRGITSISFLSSSLGGSAGQLGAVDTYRINYSDATTSTFTVTNGSPTPSAIPAANVTQTSSYRFVTDAEKSTWNAKQNALSMVTQAVAEAGTDTTMYGWSSQRVRQAINANFIQQSSKVYVSKSGNSSLSGLSPNTPKPTIAEANTVANTLISGGATRVTIEIMDSGIYTENITLSANVLLYGINATLEGTLTINTGCFVNLYAHYAYASSTDMLTKQGASHSYYRVVVHDARGRNDNLTGVNGVVNSTVGSILFLDIDLMFVNQWGIREVSSGGNGHIHLAVKDMYLAKTSAIGIVANGTESDIIGFIDHILKIGTGISSTTGIYVNTASGNVDIVATEIIADVTYNKVAGTLNITCPKLVGTTAGTPDYISTYVPNSKTLNGKTQGSAVGDVMSVGDFGFGLPIASGGGQRFDKSADIVSIWLGDTSNRVTTIAYNNSNDTFIIQRRNSSGSILSTKAYVDTDSVQTIINKTLDAVRLTESAFSATGTSGSITINCASGNKCTITPTGSITAQTFTNVPASGRSYTLILEITGAGTTYAITWNTAIKWKDNTAPTIDWTSATKNTIVLHTSDGGTTWTGRY